MNIILAIPPSPGKNNIIRLIDCSHEAKANYLWQPNDFMIITSLLKPGDGVTFIDGTADGYTEQQYLKELRRSRGDLLIAALSSVCWESDYAYFRKTRGEFPTLPTFVLGDIFLEENYQREILRECDGIIFHPYELDLDRMLHARSAAGPVSFPGVCTRPGRPFFPDGKRMITISTGSPRHELFLKKRYRFPFAHHFRFTTVTTMWGCPFSCTYCSDSNFPPVIRSCGDVLRELDYIDSLGVKELFFADKVFGFSRRNAVPLLEAMADRYRFSWSCYFHPQLYDPLLLEMMKAAGCHTIITGVDSADVTALQQYGRRVEKSMIELLIRDADRLGIDVCADFILGLEHESEDDILGTIRYALELPIDFASFNIAAPLPGSHIRKRMTGRGKLVFGKEGFDTCGRMGVLGNDNISAAKLRALRKIAFRKFYARPSYLLRRLRRTRSLEHLLMQVQEMLVMAGKV